MSMNYDVGLQVQANFTINILNTLINSNEDVAFSSYTLTLALAICYLGSSGITEIEFKKVLSPPYMMKGDYCEMLGDSFANIYGSGRGGDGIYIGNKLFFQQDYAINKIFKLETEKYFKTTFESVDFENSTFTAQKIYNFIKKSSGAKSHNTIKSDNIISSKKGIITNAFYFKGLWKESFNESLTSDGEFSTKNNKKKIVKMMKKMDTLIYGNDKNFHVVRLPYSNGNSEFVLILPKEDNMLHYYLENLKDKDLLNLIDLTYYEYVDLVMPKFTVEVSHDFKEPLIKLGVLSAFNDKANFSMITKEDNFKIDYISQKVSVDVNEEGIESDEMTHLWHESTSNVSSGNEPIVVKADHPFLYLIINENNILFAGIYQ
uniref:SERPIN domain-containing protein n=1 Tax=Strongyloides papillosus TaxID=174720 RepID=A0A0N5B9A2_STREA